MWVIFPFISTLLVTSARKHNLYLQVIIFPTVPFPLEAPVLDSDITISCYRDYDDATNRTINSRWEAVMGSLLFKKTETTL